MNDVCIIGHSLGGKVAMAIATNHPEIHDIINKIIILDILPINYSFNKYLLLF